METEPLKVRSQAYDLVLNGWELGSGSIRIHQPELQTRIFGLLGISPEEADKRFGFFLNPFRYGAPPHGGFAFGIDRLVAILAGEENIREVIAFPKTQSGTDPMTNAPTPVEAKQLSDLGPAHPPAQGLTPSARFGASLALVRSGAAVALECTNARRGRCAAPPSATRRTIAGS